MKRKPEDLTNDGFPNKKMEEEMTDVQEPETFRVDIKEFSETWMKQQGQMLNILFQTVQKVNSLEEKLSKIFK